MTARQNPYSRIYWSVMDDAKFDGIRENPRHFGSWALLLIVADMAWPAPAYIPATIPRSSIAALVDVGLVAALSGGRFRIHGLDSERGMRADHARNAAASRWEPSSNAHGMQSHPTSNAEGMPRLDKTRQDEPSIARDGLANLDRDALAALETASGHPASMAGDKTLNEYDRLVGDHGLPAVVAAFGSLANGKRMTARQLVWGAVKVLEPFISDRVAADTPASSKPFVPRKLEPWEQEYRDAIQAGYDKLADAK